MDRRHSRVKSWTKKVNIFEKDYLVIPINERSHWFLAIVCFPGLSGPVSLKDNTPIKLDPYQKLARKLPPNQSKKLVTVDGESFHIGNTTVTPVSSKAKVIMINGVSGKKKFSAQLPVLDFFRRLKTSL